MDHDVAIPADGFAAIFETLPDVAQLSGGKQAFGCGPPNPGPSSPPELVERYTICARWRGLEIGPRPYAEAFVRWAPKPPAQALLNG